MPPSMADMVLAMLDTVPDMAMVLDLDMEDTHMAAMVVTTDTTLAREKLKPSPKQLLMPPSMAAMVLAMAVMAMVLDLDTLDMEVTDMALAIVIHTTDKQLSFFKIYQNVFDKFSENCWIILF